MLEPELWLQEDDGGDFGAATIPCAKTPFSVCFDRSLVLKEVTVPDTFGELNSGKLV